MNKSRNMGIVQQEKHSSRDKNNNITCRRILCRTFMMVLIAAGVCVMGVGMGAAEDVNVTLAGHFGGTIYVTAVSGNYAYIGQGQDFVVLDISNPSSASELGRIRTGGLVRDINISGIYAYVADRYNGFVIVDISNPAVPALVGSYDTAGSAEGVVVAGSYAYVADNTNGFVIVDISNPAAPTLAGSHDTAGGAAGVAVAGSYAYVADIINGLVIVDISNPAAPVLAGSYDAVGNAFAVAISGSYAYVADNANGLVIVDISNPSSPTLAGSYDSVGHATGVAVAGNYAYIADYSGGLVIVDISNPAALVLAGSYDTTVGARDVAVTGSYAYVADRSNGLVIVDISNSAVPVLAGNYGTADSALDIAVADKYAYVADINSLVIADISNPAAPTLAGSYNTGWASGIIVAGNYTYVVDSYDGLVIIDITNPAAPTLAGSYDTAGGAAGVAVAGNYAYVADGTNGLVILRIEASGTTGSVHNINKSINYTTIQAAIDDASPGDEIHVDSGTYYENVLVDKQLTLRGIDTGGGKPVVDAGGNGNAIELIRRSADGVRLEGFAVTNAYTGIMVYSSNNTMTNNNLSNNSIGMDIWITSNNNTITNNDASNNDNGIYLGFSSNNTLRDNRMFNNNQNFGIEGQGLVYLMQDPSDNILKNTPKYARSPNIEFYNRGATGGAGGSGEGVSSFDNKFDNDIDISNLVEGKPIYYLLDASGIIIDSSSNAGMVVCIRCDDIEINGLALANNSIGIYLYHSRNSRIEHNHIYNNAAGIELWNSSNIALIGNNVSNNGNGISLSLSNSSNITNNIVGNNDRGVNIELSYFNVIYHNNFINNIQKAFDNSNNLWDYGYPSGGNYWGDYTGIDSYSGPNQDVPGSDSIGDTPYSISGSSGAIDSYPYMDENGWGADTTPPTIAITSHAGGQIVNTSSITIAGTASDDYGIANVKVNGIHAAGTTSWSADITLTEGANTITVVATDTAGNPATKTITITYTPDGERGDFNGNGRVDIGDVAKVAFMVAGKVPVDMNADFNNNGRVDIGDAAKIAFYLAGKVSQL